MRSEGSPDAYQLVGGEGSPSIGNSCSKVDKLIGLLTSTIPAVLPAPLHYRAMQRLKGKAIRNSRHNYNTVISLDKDPVKDLD